MCRALIYITYLSNATHFHLAMVEFQNDTDGKFNNLKYHVGFGRKA